ncbi:hypothetical protein [Methanoplanus limicola]|uniref:Uncharacterized protein n=1 Tax=Methanoplanus limicola DSM 2279 TaxID=937775 RepID=H1YXY8_9EURY|nr:hypothetical protein [Methanoplanus limicola]EHQ36923.1 hypothetical protein Metlim_2889 [Methanoplanus limicola DSM 2279]
MKIYVRERQKVGEGVKQPRFRIMALVGEDNPKVKFLASHYRKAEIEQMAKEIGAEIVYLEPMEDSEHGSMKH